MNIIQFLQFLLGVFDVRGTHSWPDKDSLCVSVKPQFLSFTIHQLIGSLQ